MKKAIILLAMFLTFGIARSQNLNNEPARFVSGTGIKGMKLTTRLPYMNPGIGLPDCTILNQEILIKGDEGILMTGFFGLDRSIGNGEFVPKP